MSDERRREAERRWLVSGAAADEATLLRELVLAGRLAQDAVLLAARLGHEAARLAGGPAGPLEPSALAAELVRRGTPTCVRALVALARRTEGMRPHALGCLEAAEGYAVQPSTEAARACEAWWAHGPAGCDAADGLAYAAGVVSSWHGGLPEAEEIEEALRLGAGALGSSGALAAVADELVPWLLGRSDAVAARKGLAPPARA